MRKVSILLLTVIMSFSTLSQAQPKYSIYAGGDIAPVIDPTFFREYHKTGFGGTAAIGHAVNPSFELVGSLGYHMFSADMDALNAAYWGRWPGQEVIGGGDAFIIGFEANVKFNIPTGKTGSVFQPYLAAGLGGLYLKKEGVQVHVVDTSRWGDDYSTPTNSDGYLALNMGAGFTYMFTNTLGGFVEGRFAIVPGAIYADNLFYLPIRGGFVFRFGGKA
jgi:hypothetical protein